jgi:hypothetical protein
MLENITAYISTTFPAKLIMMLSEKQMYASGAAHGERKELPKGGKNAKSLKEKRV